MKSNPKRKKNTSIEYFSFVELCEHSPEKELFASYHESVQTASLTGKELADKARSISHILQQYMKPQEKALLLFPQGLDYITGLLACFHANVVAIPAPLADKEQKNQMTAKITPILEDSQASCILTDKYFKDYLVSQHMVTLKVIDIGEISHVTSQVEERPKTMADIALLLYTSGSTSQPKGVMLSHGHVLSQATLGAKQWRIDKESRVVSWMPQFHNFGLFLNILSPLLRGASSTILSPAGFVKDPAGWFVAISHYNGTHTGAPNFAFDYCSSNIDPVNFKDLSLQSLRAIICGGEPVRKESVENFIRRFSGIGLNQNVVCPHYGMSELGSITTLQPGTPLNFIALDIPGLEQKKIKYAESDTKCKPVASCGEINAPVRIQIIDPDSCKPCRADEIGEIWIQSPSLAAGYLNRKQETKNFFSATIAGTKETGFFRTGDLGFILENHLYIVGREKEVIIIHGKNHHPADIEWTIKKYVPSLTLPVSVFSHEINDQEKVIVVQEVKLPCPIEELKKQSLEILASVSENHGLEIFEVVFVPQGSIPRTGSGKIQRKACKNAHLSQTLEVIHRFCQDNTISVENEKVSAARNNGEIVLILKKEVFHPVLKTDLQKINEAISFAELGLDSLKYVQISRKIEDVFNIQFLPVMLFKHRNFEDLANYLSPQISKTLSENLLQISAPTVGENSKTLPLPGDNDIAIIGISCHFPGGAVDPESFWENLLEQKDCITLISKSRSGLIEDDRQYYGNAGEFPEWGGFIDGVDQFDASFFNISPLEAESMDPQQRKLLELTWGVIEDGGYNPLQMAGKPVGLFVGVHNNDYAELVYRQPELAETYGAYIDSGLHLSMIAHRVSRWYDFHGPSEVINTACSSSLVAVHHAVESIRKGQSCIAIAAGINIMLTSRVYRAGHKGGMLSKDGHCKTFDKSANGFVRSEGYGAILLKPFREAVKDNDPIYGVVKKAVINHDGQSNSLRAPNMNAQRELIKAAYCEAELPPDSVSYIETHGTGTPLGDPIEIQALKEAFKEINPSLPNSVCGLGTVKTNIGHSESAAGIAGVIKVLMSMKYRKLPGIIHFKELNPYIELNGSPFYIVDQTKDWERLKHENGDEIPNRAGISSFGFGGANAHVIIEEYIPDIADWPKKNAVIVPISAKNKECLIAYVNKLHGFLAKFLEELKGSEKKAWLDLSGFAYTFQTGRAAMEERVAFLAKDWEELLQKMLGFKNGKETISECWQGHIKQNQSIRELLGNDEDAEELIRKWVSKGKLAKVAQYWTQGGHVEWYMLDGQHKPSRVHLPTYPFSPEKYWIQASKQAFGSYITSKASMSIHPLLQQNVSDLSVQRFTSIFNGQEHFLADHIVNGQKILPGTAYLEMARAAISKSIGGLKENSILRLRNIFWASPIVLDDKDIRVNIDVFPEGNNEISFRIYVLSNPEEEEPSINCQGSAVIDSDKELQTIDIANLKAACNLSVLSHDMVYKAFRNAGIVYGKTHQLVEEIYVGPGQALAKLSQNTISDDAGNLHMLSPGLLDSALQASIVFWNNYGIQKPALPFALKELEIMASCNSAKWAIVRPGKEQKQGEPIQNFDIDVCDDYGKILVKFTGFSTRMLSGKGDVSGTNTGTIILEPTWEEQQIIKKGEPHTYSQHLIIGCDMQKLTFQMMEAAMDNTRCVNLQSAHRSIEKRFEQYAGQVFEEIRQILTNKPSGKILVQIVSPLHSEEEIFRGLYGILRSAGLENPNLVGQWIGYDDDSQIVTILKENSLYTNGNQILYQQRNRYILNWNELECPPGATTIPWKEKGVYLISGGAGGLGLIFANEIVLQAQKITLILTGRSPLNSEKLAILKKLEAFGSILLYRQVDVSDANAVNELMQYIQQEFGHLDGIIHSAGVIKDNFIIKKDHKELEEVMAPKVTGLVNLDEASKDLPLDFFIIFSSIAGSLGNAGQADYAAANAFMDAYSVYRTKLVNERLRHGHTLAINWPLWKEGGMHIDKETQKMMMEETGMTVMDASTGIQALYRSLASGKPQTMVLKGQTDKIKQVLINPVTFQAVSIPDLAPVPDIKENAKPDGTTQDALQNKAESFFKNLLSEVLKIPVRKIEADAPMEKYGIDSVMVLQLTNKLERTFGSLSKTLFFEYQNIRNLAEYFLKSHYDQMIQLLRIDEKPLIAGETNKIPTSLPELTQPTIDLKKRPRFAFSPATSLAEKKAHPLDIAIIGMAGRYPQADNIREFWKNIIDGKDCITEIPKERWDYNIYFDENRNMPGKTYSKWGGFLTGVDLFDPLFFSISPREAELMSPQERIFLQCAYETIEDAGYTRDTLARVETKELNGNVGVFVGAMSEEYPLYGAQEQIRGNPVALSGSLATIANRVSYFCNFHGPSMTIDTMCASSLTSVHLACQSIRNGDCTLAIAGGVNLSVHPNKYLGLAQGKFISGKGRCETFGENGDGYVPSEGVGALLLKPLQQAIADGDNIYGVIKGSAINHGGKTNGYTVPNPNAQAEVIGRAIKEAGVNPRAVSYIEAHGTGTSLGDPIEITGLTKAFSEYTKEKQFCAIGSVKSNIGHCEGAAGMAGLTKVLLQLCHKQLVPSLHSKALNPNIDFSSTPFTVQQEPGDWERPVLSINEVQQTFPRIAGISSFGAGGANAHVVIEEYIPQKTGHSQTPPTSNSPVIITLSAKSREQLIVKAQQLLDFISDQQMDDQHLTDMAYTLQIGREAMEERIGFIVLSMEELRGKLKGFAEGNENIEGFYQGQVAGHKEALAVFNADEDLQEALDKWIQHGKYEKILDLWVKGLSFDWNKIYNENNKPRRISLPTYSFAKERYWVPNIGSGKGKEKAKPVPVNQMSTTTASLHLNKNHTPENRLQPEITSQDALLSFTIEYVSGLISKVLKLNISKIQPETGFEEFGLDSVLVVQLNALLGESIGAIPSTLLFSHNNIKSLAQYLVKEHHEKLALLLHNEKDNTILIKAPTLPIEPQTQAPHIAGSGIIFETSKNKGNNDIAIIGLSGRYPNAETLDEFWKILESGTDCIIEIPKERWDYRKYNTKTDNKGSKNNIMYCKWGGFINDIDKFDPQFFNISPREAYYLDPQERLFLQAAAACFENASYSRQLLQSKQEGRGAPVGVFAGVTFNNYHLYAHDEHLRGNYVPVNSQIFSVANRVSYFFNLRGPSLSVDTACSSSLYSVHLACESLKSGECEMAIAGGVNLSLHPSKYITLCVTQFASSSGHCNAFGEGGDGYVPGEGVGAVLLKPLEKAISDRDYIYAVIKGSACNHDGKTYGYSVPNPVAQSEVVQRALYNANINPRSISYVEAHGTGTKLGDPIEVSGLTDAYKAYSTDKQFCAIGSVKSNIGHLEAAAGISQLTKVILQMKHKKLVPSLLHSPGLNPNICFEETPFYVQRKLSNWEQPVVEINGQSLVCPRRAGISSFGAGGVNVHLILEEYQAKPETINREVTISRPVVIVLSAKTKISLRVYALSIKTYIESLIKDNVPADRLVNIAYTLQVGRDPLPFRLAIVCRNYHELVEKLEIFLDNHTTSGLYVSEATPKEPAKIGSPAVPINVNTMPETLAEFWCKGTLIKWEMIYQDTLPGRIPLPTYPFSKESYWFEQSYDHNDNQSKGESVVPPPDMAYTNDKPDVSPFLTKIAEALAGERQEMLEAYIRDIVSGLLAFTPPNLPELQQGFFDMGMESIMAVKFQAQLENKLNIKLSDSAMFDYPNIRALASHILGMIPFNEPECQVKSQAGNDQVIYDEPIILDEVSEVASMDLEEVVAELKNLISHHN